GGVEDCAIQILRDLSAARAPDSVVAGTETNHRVVATLFQAGAADYFALPQDLGICRSWMAEQVQRAEDRRNGARFAADERERFDFSKMIGSSPLLRAALRRTA